MGVSPDLQLLSRTIRIGFDKQAGTALYMQHLDTRFLLTAAHILRGAQTGNRLAVRHASEWATIEISRIEFANDSVDACLVVPSTQWGDGLSAELLRGDVIIGEDVAFCGFPLGLEMQGMPEMGVWPTALAKSGTFSGGVKIDGQTVFLFDATNNVGFSGGPIIRRNAQRGNALEIVGIVSGYKYDAPQPVLQKTEAGEYAPTGDYFVRPNSGFMYGVPSFHLRKLVERVIGQVPDPQS